MNGRRRVAAAVPHRAVALGAAVVAVDQVTKAAASSVGDRAVIVPVENPDYALGLVSAPSLVLCVGMVAVIAAAWWAPRRWPVLADHWWVTPLFAAGAVANLTDRLLHGAVRDFVATPWFVFNAADVAIAAALIGCYQAITRRHRTSRQASRGPTIDPERR